MNGIKKKKNETNSFARARKKARITWSLRFHVLGGVSEELTLRKNVGVDADTFVLWPLPFPPADRLDPFEVPFIPPMLLPGLPARVKSGERKEGSV